MKDIRQKLLATFQVEHRDHVEQIRSLLAMIGKTAGHPGGAELEEAFRRAHSLKGAARAVDLRAVEGLAHRLETLFSRVRQGSLVLDKDVTAAAQQALDASEDCVTALGENRPAPGFEAALRAIERVLGMESASPPPAAKEPRPVEQAPQPEILPAFEPLDTVRGTARNFDGLLRSAGTLLIETERRRQVTAQWNTVTRQVAAIEKTAGDLRREATRGASAALCPLAETIERQAQSIAKQARKANRLQRTISQTIDRLAVQLRQDVWQARMVPADSLFEGYRKIIRDLARDEGKQIEFKTLGAGALADRSVLEKLKDPLMHALRNAVSHGIESPQERASKGKPPQGLVTLRIEAEGQRLNIGVEDDGAGMDLRRVAEVAVRQGILSEQEAAYSSEQDLTKILFRPGFSTARQITDLSGRGMGLSVMYEAVRRLQGELHLQSRENGGLTLRVSVPVSIATHRLLLVACEGQTFGVPIAFIESLRRVKVSDVKVIEGKPVITLGNHQVLLVSLARFLNPTQTPSSAAKAELRVLILRAKNQRIAASVNAFLGEMEAVIQDLGPAGPRDARVSGGFLLEDGAVAFSLNPMQLFESPAVAATPGEWRPAEAKAQKAPASILVVDDSLTTRTLEKSILEAQGYRVRVAVDGMEALLLLRFQKADLVISDVQMPRLDGFGLLTEIKKDPALSAIPVILVTSLDQREDRERGLGLGAGAYIVKRKFDQEELLATIRQIL